VAWANPDGIADTVAVLSTNIATTMMSFAATPVGTATEDVDPGLT
jgi:hypothetical protein